MLLDDVLSALDVHTARSVVEKCFAGSLLEGRTVILVTHNVAMAGPLAKNVVEIASDGTISQKDSLAAALSTNAELRNEAAQDVEAMEKDAGVVDGSKPAEEAAKPSGKLIADEEVALGRVSVTSSKLSDLIGFLLMITDPFPALVTLYFANMGGVSFWLSFAGLLMGTEFLNVYVRCLSLSSVTEVALDRFL